MRKHAFMIVPPLFLVLLLLSTATSVMGRYTPNNRYWRRNFFANAQIVSTPAPIQSPSPTPAVSPTATPASQQIRPTSTPTPAPTATPVTAQAFLWGAYTGHTQADATAFESLVGKQMDVEAVFVHWGNENEFPTEFASALKPKNKTLLVFWEAKDYNIDSVIQPRFNFDAVIRGDWDDYFLQFAKDAKAYGGPVIMVPFDEMNGDWSPWSGLVNGNTPAKYVQAYQHVRGFFKDAPNVKFGWAVNNDSTPDTTANRFENYYPGDAYVDYVGVDGFNFNDPNDGGWESWDSVYADSLNRLDAYKKPIFIFSSGSAAGTQKASWINDFSKLKNYPRVVGWIWFNENKEKDWRVNSDASALSAYKQVISGL